jgi:hypothetical protein
LSEVRKNDDALVCVKATTGNSAVDNYLIVQIICGAAIYYIGTKASAKVKASVVGVGSDYIIECISVELAPSSWKDVRLTVIESKTGGELVIHDLKYVNEDQNPVFKEVTYPESNSQD